MALNEDFNLMLDEKETTETTKTYKIFRKIGNTAIKTQVGIIIS